MSDWLHVCAVVRVDCFRFNGHDIDFEKVFGKTLRYEDPLPVWEECEKHPSRFLPYGSEGSLQMCVWEEPDKNCIPSYTVSIFGDLRDRTNGQKILDWFKERLEMIAVRQAVITIRGSACPTITWGSDMADG